MSHRRKRLSRTEIRAAPAIVAMDDPRKHARERRANARRVMSQSRLQVALTKNAAPGEGCGVGQQRSVNVRSCPIADKLLQCRECPLCAISGLMHCNKTRETDYLRRYPFRPPWAQAKPQSCHERASPAG